MQLFLLTSLYLVACIILIFIYRVVRGPNVFDRLIGLNGIATKTIIFFILLGLYQQELGMYVDIALGYGLLNLVGALAIGKYLEKEKGVAK